MAEIPHCPDARHRFFMKVPIKWHRIYPSTVSNGCTLSLHIDNGDMSAYGVTEGNVFTRSDGCSTQFHPQTCCPSTTLHAKKLPLFFTQTSSSNLLRWHDVFLKEKSASRGIQSPSESGFMEPNQRKFSWETSDIRTRSQSQVIEELSNSRVK